MNCVETLHWILDKTGGICKKGEDVRENIAFVHSLGKKCDSVGWSCLRRDDPRAEEILEKIASFCMENGWTARGLYTREYTDFDTDWYQIVGTEFQDSTFGNYVRIPAQGGGSVLTCSIKAYREPAVAPKSWGDMLFVPEEFYRTYQETAMTGLDFCWAKDVGKYAAQQYFEVFATERIPQVAVAWDLKKQDLRKLGPDGGWLPRLGEVFREWSQLILPYCYRKADMPAGGIAYAYIPWTVHCCGLRQILVHKDVAQRLVQENAIPERSLKPIPVLEQIPAGYALQETSDYPRPTKHYMEQSFSECEAMKRKQRPVWLVSEKEAVKALRKAKTNRQEDFGKRMPKKGAEAASGTPLEPMLPYYLIADGGVLSEEYRLLSAEEAKAETDAFRGLLETEETAEEKPEGVVICTCADGDRVLLTKDGTVVRVSHEGPEITEKWSSLAQFITETINM